MPRDDAFPLFSRRDAAARRRRRAHVAFGLVGALALALATAALATDGTGELPPGHPPIGADRLPPGHPPIDGGTATPACDPDLPRDHPPVTDPRLPEGHPPVEIRPCAPRPYDGVFRPEPVQFSAVPTVIET